MTIETGRALLHYRLIEKIGEGGMGVVWKALDTTLDREVAIKFIPEEFASDNERLARFVGEAKLLATLNHPNIASVYGLHESDPSTPSTGSGQAGSGQASSVHFIAMEYIPGEDLAQRLARGPLDVENAIDVARQVSDALEAAHEQGVIHRDLKPGNIKRTPDGKIKVLDLGLAKALASDPVAGSTSVSLSPTVTSAGTVAGTLLGTAAYMSPEQAKGRPVDRRADIWAFGVVLHEMLTGQKLFEAETVSETLAAVLRDEVSMTALPGDTPASVVSLIGRCLDRDPRTRLRDIGEARISLSSDAPAGGVAVQTAAPPEQASPSRTGGWLPWALVGLLAIVAMVLMWRGSPAPAPDDELLTLVAAVPDELRIPSDQMGIMALSPDGKTLALVLFKDADKLLFVRKLDSAELVQMPGTENAATPFFSPDGKWIAFFADDKLKKISVDGGAPVTLCDSNGNNRGGDWGTDDFIVFSPHYTQPLMRVHGAGGEATALTSIDSSRRERTHRWPHAVPGEDLVLYTVGTMDSPESYDDARIEAIRPSTGERQTVLERASMARYVPSGHLVFGREGFLFAVRFDVKNLKVLGSPVPVLENVMGMRNSGIVHFGIAQNGLLAYVAGAPRSRQARLVWRSRDGRTEPLAAPVSGYLNPRVSPDGEQIAAQIEGGTTFDVWTYHLEQDTLTRLTFEGDNTNPIWSPDGRRIAFSSVRDNALMSAYVKDTDGSGQAELVFSPIGLEKAGQVAPRDWTLDGKSLILQFTNENSINLATFSEERDEFQVLLETPAIEAAPALSPNGRWLAYTSDDSGEFQVFVRAFPGPGGKWQVSTDGGAAPRWSPDGTELYYRWQSELHAVAVDDSGGSFRVKGRELLFDDLTTTTVVLDYDVLDADRFLLVERAGDDTDPPGVTVVVNWLAELERRIPE